MIGEKGIKGIYNLLLGLSIALGIIFLYALLHEGSHAVFAIFFGGDLVEFDVNIFNGSPHIRYIGEIASWKKGIISIAGPLVPYFIWVIFIIRVKKNTNIILKKTLLFSSFGMVATLLVNAILPILNEAGANLQGEDLIKFINYTNMNSYVVSIAHGILLILSVYMLYKKMDIKEIIVQQIDVNIKNKKQKIDILFMTFLVIVVLSMTTINVFPIKDALSTWQPPKEYDHFIKINLEDENASSKTVYEFEVKEPKMYSFYSSGNSTEKIKLSVEGETYFTGVRDQKMIFFDGQGKMNNIFLGWYLKEGKYKIKLSSQEKKENKGEIELYIKTEDVPQEYERYSNEKIFNGELPQLNSAFELVAKENLENTQEKNIYEFTLEEDKTIEFSIFLTTKQGRAVVTLSGNGNSEVLINDYQIYTDGRGASLKKGKYTITISSEDCDGEIYVFIKNL